MPDEDIENSIILFESSFYSGSSPTTKLEDSIRLPLSHLPTINFHDGDSSNIYLTSNECQALCTVVLFKSYKIL